MQYTSNINVKELLQQHNEDFVYLQKQLDSILNQSYSDFELVICDDCSIEDTTQESYDFSRGRFKI